jgi:hypothetical protein
LRLCSRDCLEIPHLSSFEVDRIPFDRSDFEGYQSFRTHDLDVLLHLSGMEAKIKAGHLAEWSIVAAWDPNTRYRRIGSASRREAADMITATRVLLAAL